LDLARTRPQRHPKSEFACAPRDGILHDAEQAGSREQNAEKAQARSDRCQHRVAGEGFLHLMAESAGPEDRHPRVVAFEFLPRRALQGRRLAQGLDHERYVAKRHLRSRQEKVGRRRFVQIAGGPVLRDPYHLPHGPVHLDPLAQRLFPGEHLGRERSRDHDHRLGALAVVGVDRATRYQSRPHDREIVPADIVLEDVLRRQAGNFHPHRVAIARPGKRQAPRIRSGVHARQCRQALAGRFAPFAGCRLLTRRHCHYQ